jgi:hypothetical protein
MTLHLLDIAAYQAGLRLEDAKAAGFRAINIKLSHGMGLRASTVEARRLARESLPRRFRAGQVIDNPKTWVDKARTLGMGVCAFHWLNDSAPGADQARWFLSRMDLAGGRLHVGAQADCESNATQAIWRDFVWAMQDTLQRPIVNYSGDWWWTAAGRGWNGASLTPYHWSAPNSGYLASYPGDTSTHWRAGYGGWPELAVMQYAVGPLPGGTIKVSKSAIRDLTVWAGITGGDSIVPKPDPGNAPPEAWSTPMHPADIAAFRDQLAAQRVSRTEFIRETWPDFDPDQAAPLDDLAGDLIVPRGAGEVCAPAIVSEMSEWVALGGGNSGCVGDPNHTSGFHRGASFVPATDYSRRRDPNGADGPFTSWNYSCAGDYAHRGTAALRARHAALLDRLMDDDPSLRMVCEMITQPIAGQPVKYWARWEGTGSLRNYTGSGHDTWSHVSLYRSKADQRPYLWRGDMALTNADADVVLNRDVVANPKQRSDAATNPTTAVKFALGDMWQLLYNNRDTVNATRADVTKTLQQIAAGFAADTARDQATAQTITEMRRIVDGLLAMVQAGGGNVDVAPLVQRLDALPGLLTQTAAGASERAAELVAGRIAEGQRAAAEALADSSDGT